MWAAIFLNPQSSHTPRRLGLRPLVPRGREGPKGLQGAKSREGSRLAPYPPQCRFCPGANAPFTLQALRLQGRRKAVWCRGRGRLGAPAGPARGGAARRAEDARPSLLRLPAGAAPRLGPRAGWGFSQNWAVRASERPRGSHATARVPDSGRSFPAGVSLPAGRPVPDARARTHTHTYTQTETDTHARARPLSFSAALAPPSPSLLLQGAGRPHGLGRAGPSRGRGGELDPRGSRARGGASGGGVAGCSRPSSE